MHLLFTAFCAFVLATAVHATTYTVTTASDAGAGSLREAITLSNAAGGSNVIEFAISGTGPHVILVSTALPAITASVKIDGSTQAGYTVGNPQILLDGNNINVHGLHFQADSCEVNGLLIRKFVTSGGTKSNLWIDGDYCRVINCVSHQSRSALYIMGNYSTIQGNKFDTNLAGTAATTSIKSTISGKGHLFGGSNPGARNLFVRLHFDADSSILENNFLGVNITGDTSIASTELEFYGEYNTVKNNLASNIHFYSGNNTIIGNKFGTDSTGTKRMQGSIGTVAFEGGNIVGGYVPGEGNLIVQNANASVILGPGNQFIGNKIGTDITGTTMLARVRGIFSSGTTPGSDPILIEKNTIIGVTTYASIYINGMSNVTIKGNYIGTDSTGTINLGGTGEGIYIRNIAHLGGPFGQQGVNSHNIVIGGTGPGDANIIAFHDSIGIELEGPGASDATYNTKYVTISRNILKQNGKSIELNSSHAFPPNNGKQPPVITNAYSPTSTITGTAGSGNTGDVIEVFESDSTGNDALRFLGQATVAGNGSWTLTGVPGIASMKAIVATQTDYAGKNAPNLENTSGFSAAFFINGSCTVNLGNDTTLCAGNALMLNATSACYHTYSWNTGATTAIINVTTSGTYIVSATGVFGIADYDTITVQFTPGATTNLNVSICDGDSFFVAGAWQTTAGVYYDTLPGSSVCDSILITNLTVLANSFVSRPVTICLGDSVFVGGVWRTLPGTYYDTFVSAVGCDSVITTIVSVTPQMVVNSPLTICTGDSVFIAGAWRTTAGVYHDTFTNVTGCDSIIAVNLSIVNSITVNTQALICMGDSVFAGGAWQTQSGIYRDTFSVGSGCDSVIITAVSVLSIVIDTVQITTCARDSVLIGGAWYFGPVVIYDTATASGGCDSVTMVQISVNTGVWPGDADNDGIANNYDLLVLGLSYGTVGIARDSVSNAWVGYCADDWSSTQINGLNMKHADCNGDGVVNAADTLAINLNYGLTHSKSEGSRSSAGAALTVVPYSAISRPGDLVTLDVELGDDITPVDELYGIAFTLSFDETMVEPGSVTLTYPDSWMGNIASNLKLSKIFEQDGNADGALTRINHQNASGYGAIARLQFRIKTGITTLQNTTVAIDYKAIKANGDTVLFNITDAEFLIDGTNGISAPGYVAAFDVYPNPFTTNAIIEFSLEKDALVSFRVLDLPGKVVFESPATRMASGMHQLQYANAVSATGLFIVELNVNGVGMRKRIVRVE